MTEPSAARDLLCYALDFPSLIEALRGAEAVVEHVGVFKLGLELFAQSGPDGVKAIRRLGRRVFLDLKLHDIPRTVERAVMRVAELQVDYLTVHACGGTKMLLPAAQRLVSEASELKLLGVTVLTSASQSDAEEVGMCVPLADQALRLAHVAQAAGLQGLVCSPQELVAFRAQLGATIELVTPGIRPKGCETDDQQRVGTPGAAIQAGSSLLVVGRPIRDAPDPASAAAAICAEIAESLS